MTTFDAPESVTAEVVAAALAEDLGLLGDITSIACIRDDETASAVFERPGIPRQTSHSRSMFA